MKIKYKHKASLGRKIFSIYAVTYFFILTFFAVLFYIMVTFLPERKRLVICYKYNAVWLKLWCLGTGISVRIEGRNMLQKDKNYVFVSNHSNILDILINGALIHHPYKSLIKKELLKVPLMNFIFKRLCIVVDRSSDPSKTKSFKEMVVHLQQGVSILIYPEGTRNRTDKPLKSFYVGAFKLAIHQQVEIVPIVLLNIRDLNPVGTFWLYPGTITFKMLPPIATRGTTVEQADEVKELVWKILDEEIRMHDDRFTQTGHISQP